MQFLEIAAEESDLFQPMITGSPNPIIKVLQQRKVKNLLISRKLGQIKLIEILRSSSLQLFFFKIKYVDFADYNNINECSKCNYLVTVTIKYFRCIFSFFITN